MLSKFLKGFYNQTKKLPAANELKPRSSTWERMALKAGKKSYTDIDPANVPRPNQFGFLPTPKKPA